MATGDNVLTAISVARQSKILESSKKVYLGDLITDELGNSCIQWTTEEPENIIRSRSSVKT